ncbi:hypothetical protein P4O66_002036 [Electrophorus voltai]|uniref:Uncharacterized protein n=1 Tax=Electrophorus voltai TaxID=2609070 RepID=A0AAD8Z4B8_9TELE|nr:hypothetical protein P4O66_002036 [Electrophorus voltai]
MSFWGTNTFFTRFVATSSSANANSASANNPNGAIGAANGACTEPTIEQRPLIVTESDVRRVFKRVTTTKAASPHSICKRVLKACADQLAPVFNHLQSLPDAQYRPIQLQVIHHRPRPKETSTLRPQ